MKFWYHHCQPRQATVGFLTTAPYCKLCGKSQDKKVQIVETETGKIIEVHQFADGSFGVFGLGPFMTLTPEYIFYKNITSGKWKIFDTHEVKKNQIPRHEQIISELQSEISELRAQRRVHISEIHRLKNVIFDNEEKIQIVPVHDFAG